MAYAVPKLKSYTTAALDKAVVKLLAALDKEAKTVQNEEDWKMFRDRWMARKNGVLTQINDLWLKTAPKDAKRDVGQRVNQLNALVEEAVAKAKNLHPRLGVMSANIQANSSARGRSTGVGSLSAHVQGGSSVSGTLIDITLPGNRRPLGAEHPVKADVGCRNTVFNSRAQSGADCVSRLLQLGVRHFRLEFLNESPDQVSHTIASYQKLLGGEITSAQLWREVKAIRQLGVTRATVG